jgi:hypothetical protein
VLLEYNATSPEKPVSMADVICTVVCCPGYAKIEIESEVRLKLGTAFIVMDKSADAVCGGTEESLAVTVNLATPGAAGVPRIRPPGSTFGKGKLQVVIAQL